MFQLDPGVKKIKQCSQLVLVLPYYQTHSHKSCYNVLSFQKSCGCRNEERNHLENLALSLQSCVSNELLTLQAFHFQVVAVFLLFIPHFVLLRQFVCEQIFTQYLTYAGQFLGLTWLVRQKQFVLPEHSDGDDTVTHGVRLMLETFKSLTPSREVGEGFPEWQHLHRQLKHEQNLNFISYFSQDEASEITCRSLRNDYILFMVCLYIGNLKYFRISKHKQLYYFGQKASYYFQLYFIFR